MVRKNEELSNGLREEKFGKEMEGWEEEEVDYGVYVG